MYDLPLFMNFADVSWKFYSGLLIWFNDSSRVKRKKIRLCGSSGEGCESVFRVQQTISTPVIGRSFFNEE